MTFNSGTMRSGPHRARRYSRSAPPAPPSASEPFEGATTVEDLLAYVNAGATEGEVAERAAAILTSEETKPEDDRRVTLVEPLTAILEAATTTSDPQPGADADGFGGDAPEPAADTSEGSSGA